MQRQRNSAAGALGAACTGCMLRAHGARPGSAVPCCPHAGTSPWIPRDWDGSPPGAPARSVASAPGDAGRVQAGLQAGLPPGFYTSSPLAPRWFSVEPGPSWDTGAGTGPAGGRRAERRQQRPGGGLGQERGRYKRHGVTPACCVPRGSGSIFQGCPEQVLWGSAVGPDSHRDFTAILSPSPPGSCPAGRMLGGTEGPQRRGQELRARCPGTGWR